MDDLKNLGTILALYIQYADDEDVFQLIKFTFPDVAVPRIKRSGQTVKEYLLQLLCEPQYRIFESVYNENLKQVKKYLNTSRLEILIFHLLTLFKCYFHNFLFLERERKKNKNEDTQYTKPIIEKLENLKISSKKGFLKILKEGNITEDEIPKILHILVDDYKKYGFYYLFNGDYIKKVKIVYKKGLCGYDETEYYLRLLERKTYFINTQTNHKIEVNKPIRQFFKNENGVSDIESLSYNKFQKINNAICEGLGKDIPKETCAWCNPHKYKKQRKLCDNCNYLLERLRLLQAKELISKFNIFEEMTKYSWEQYKTLKGLRQKRKEHLIELLGNFYGLNSGIARELKDVIEKSFRDIY